MLRIRGAGTSTSKPQDVTTNAVEFLMARLELSPDVRLLDLLGLFKACPALHPVFRRFYSEDICADADLDPLPDEDKSDCLFLELRKTWFYNSHLREYSDVRDLQLIGVGHAPKSDPNYLPDADGFYRYSLLGTPVRAVLTLPIRLSSQVRVFESDPYAVRYNQHITTVHDDSLTLGESLQAMLWELTWFGPPDAAESVVNELAEQWAGTDEWETFTAEEMWAANGALEFKHACEMVFESTGACEPYALIQAIGRIPDSISAQRWLRQTLNKTLRLRFEFRGLNGRGLRKAIDQESPKPHSHAA